MKTLNFPSLSPIVLGAKITVAYLQNNQPSSTTFTMLRRASLTTISGIKTLRKELDLLTEGKITGQAELEATPTQISRNLNVLRTTINEVLGRLYTASFEVNKPRSGRSLSIISQAARILLRQL
jgi:hypothetical protein